MLRDSCTRRRSARSGKAGVLPGAKLHCYSHSERIRVKARASSFKLPTRCVWGASRPPARRIAGLVGRIVATRHGGRDRDRLRLRSGAQPGTAAFVTCRLEMSRGWLGAGWTASRGVRLGIGGDDSVRRLFAATSSEREHASRCMSTNDGRLPNVTKRLCLVNVLPIGAIIFNTQCAIAKAPKPTER